jgi:hypothetical protein
MYWAAVKLPSGAAAHHCGEKLNQGIERVKCLYQILTTIISCCAGGGWLREGAYQTVLKIVKNF